jgi:hypothetical protein
VRALLLVVFLVAGCGGGPEIAVREVENPSAEPTPYPVAFEIQRKDARRLLEQDAYAFIERTGEVVGATDWESYFALVLEAWLSERGIDIDASEYRTTVSRLAKEQEFHAIFITGEHSRALQRLRPTERQLRRYWERFSEESLGTAGVGMLEWLEIFRRAAQRAGPDSVVVIRLVD